MRREDAGFLDRGDGERLAWKRVAGRGPAVVWMGGYASDMEGTKARALADWAAERGRSFLRFDWFGHGASSGEFAAGTITRWRADALAVLEQLVKGPAVLVGSSMGGWLACLAALARPERVAALVLIAPAADFTERLIEPALTAEARAALAEHGVWRRPSDYGGEQVVSRILLEDGCRWSILPGPVRIDVPVRVLQGGADPDIPWRHALALADAITTENLVFTLIRDGDHRLSRPQDLARLVAAVQEVT